MDDFTYDIVQKKRIAHGAKHMKRGSKSRKCSLPSDHLTPAQLKRRNGPVATYKLDAPMKWDDFKAMPKDLQKKYLTYLREDYHAPDRLIGRLLGVSEVTVFHARKRLGITGRMPPMTYEEAMVRDAKWDAFCNGVVGGGDAEKPTAKLDPLEEVTPTEAPETEDPVRFDSEESAQKAMELIQEPIFTPVEVAVKPKLTMTDLTATFKGEFDGERFLKWLSQFPIPEGYVKIRVEVTTDE